jgi:hypothetical protein
MSQPAEIVRVIELDTFNGKSGRTLMVHLPSHDGRSRVAFVPLQAQLPAAARPEAAERWESLVEALLAT